MRTFLAVTFCLYLAGLAAAQLARWQLVVWLARGLAETIGWISIVVTFTLLVWGGVISIFDRLDDGAEIKDG